MTCHDEEEAHEHAMHNAIPGTVEPLVRAHKGTATVEHDLMMQTLFFALNMRCTVPLQGQ